MNATGTEALVCQDIADRQRIGIQKYGTTVEKNRLTVSEWAMHAYEEALDLPIYLKRLTGAAEALERELENMKAERNRWRNMCNRLHNALRCANNGFTGDAYSQRVIDDADQTFMKAIKYETKPTLERTQNAVILGETKEDK